VLNRSAVLIQWFKGGLDVKSQNGECNTHTVIAPEGFLFSWQCVLMLD